MPCPGCLGCSPSECGAFSVALGWDKRLVAPPGHHPVSLPSLGLLPIIPPCHSDSVTGTAPRFPARGGGGRACRSCHFSSSPGALAGPGAPSRGASGCGRCGTCRPGSPPCAASAASPPRAGGDRCCHMFCSWILPPSCAWAACTGTLPWARAALSQGSVTLCGVLAAEADPLSLLPDLGCCEDR